MNGELFVNTLSKAFKAGAERIPTAVEPAKWTMFMQGCLLNLAELRSMHVCARGLGKIPGRKLDPSRHMPSEFLFDFTLYEYADWTDWSLPSVIIEHENEWTERAFLQDFWKLLVGHAPLRVMFGYARSLSEVDARVASLLRQEHENRWSYPPTSEDLVLLRCPDGGGLPWPDWRVLHRPKGEGWRSAQTVTLDGRPVVLR